MSLNTQANLLVVAFFVVCAALIYWKTEHVRQFGHAPRTGKDCVEVIERVFAARNIRPPTEAEQADLDDCDDDQRPRNTGRN